MPRTEELSALAEAAFRQAAVKVIERARQTGTPVILWRDGRVVEVPWDQVQLPDRKLPEVRNPPDDLDRTVEAEV